MADDIRSVSLPRYFIGSGAYRMAPTVIAPLGEKVFLIGGARALAAGWPALEESVRDSAVSLADIHTFSGECTLDAARALAESAYRLGAQVVAGMGGGKAIDVAKACGQLANLPVITFPTIAATCAAVTRLSVMYREDGAFDRFLFLDAPPRCALIDTAIIARAPIRYLRAGMGDALAKYAESEFSARGDALAYEDELGLAVARTCYHPLLRVGRQALADCERHLDTDALRQAAQCAIVSTGTVSLLVKECYNGALAHSLYYAMEGLTAINRCLHGDVVAWGALVQWAMDGQTARMAEAFGLLKSLGVPTSLSEMGQDVADPDFLKALEDVPVQSDMAHLPYPVTAEMALAAILQVEAYAAAHAG